MLDLHVGFSEEDALCCHVSLIHEVRQPARCAAAKHQEEVKQKKYHESDDYDVVHTVQWHISDGAVDEVNEDGRNWFSVRRL